MESRLAIPAGLLWRRRALALAHALRMGTVAVLAGLLALACGKAPSTQGAVEVPIKAVSPQERIAKLAKIQKSHGANTNDGVIFNDQKNITLSGRLLGEDGKAITGTGTSLTIECKRAGSSYAMSAYVKPDGTFSHKVPYGTIHLSVLAPGYAFLWVGPFKTSPGGKIENLSLVLKHGFKAGLKLADPQGRPITSATLTGYFNTPTNSHMYAWGDRSALHSDGRGAVALDNMTTIPLFLKAVAPGYEETQWTTVKLEPGSTVTLTMNPTPPTEGVVTAAADGWPVPGATLRLLAKEGGLTDAWGADEGPILATADEEGRFRLDTLRRDTRYTCYVDAPGFRREIIKGIRAGQEPLKIALGPRLAVSGRILAPENADKYDGKPYISFSQGFSVEGYSSGGSAQSLELIVRDGIGYFDYSRLWPGEVTIMAGSVRKTIKVKESVKDLTIDLRPPQEIQSEANKTTSTAPAATTINPAAATSATREVVFRFALPPDSPPANGTMTVNYVSPETPNIYDHPQEIPVINNEARLRGLPVPTKITYSEGKLVGYWFSQKYDINVPADTGPFEVTIPALAAGAIYGQVMEADGTSATEVMISVTEVEKAPQRQNDFLNIQGKNGTYAGDTVNTFNMAPLPLGGTYAVVARRNSTFAVSQPIKLTESKPIVELTLILPKGVALRGRVLDETGRPLPQVKIKFSYESPNSGYSISPVTTGDDGAFVFEAVNPGVRGNYSLSVEASGYQTKYISKIPDLTKPMEIRLKRGSTLTGRVIDAETGKPLDRIEVYAYIQRRPEDTDEDNIYGGFLDADEKTNERGEFRFSRLDGGRTYEIHTRDSQIATSATTHREITAIAGQAQPVVVPVKLYEWEKKRRAGMDQ